MQLSQTRLVCRAPNRFNPSIALWQHFVEASPSKPRDRRQLSTATEAAQGDANANSKDGKSEARVRQDTEAVPERAADEPSAEAEAGTRPLPLPLRKMTTVKGRWQTSKVEASIAKNKHLKKALQKASPVTSKISLVDAKDAFDTRKDYKGIVVKSMVGEPVRESALPWSVKKEYIATVTGIDRLQSEIAKFYKYTKPTRSETLARNHLVEQVRGQVRKCLPKFNVEVFGSERTGIAMPLSDIDFRLLYKSADKLHPAEAKFPPAPIKRAKGLQLLSQLYNKEFKKNQSYVLAAVRHARYPLVTAQDKESGLDIQIVLANDTSISRVIMQEYMEEIPYLKQLYWVVKTIFDVRGLSDVFRGGFGSYSIFMMLVASIKHAPEPPGDSARALLHFLDFWANFDTRKHGVSIEPAYLFDKTKYPVLTDTQSAQLENGEIEPLPAYMLSLRDPADETNDLGRKGIAIKHVQTTFRDLHLQLAFDTKVNTRRSLLAPLVGQSYMLQLERRKKLQEYGRTRTQREFKELAQMAKTIREGGSVEKALPPPNSWRPVLSLGAGVVPNPSQPKTQEKKAPRNKAREEAELEEAEEEAAREEALQVEREKEEPRLRLAREARDREWQRLREEREMRAWIEEGKEPVLEHDGAVADVSGLSVVEQEVETLEGSVEEEAQTDNDGVEQDVQTSKDGVEEEVLKGKDGVEAEAQTSEGTVEEETAPSKESAERQGADSTKA